MKASRGRGNPSETSGWAKKFVAFIQGRADSTPSFEYIAPEELIKQIPDQRVILFVDYDGTLFPIVRIPELAKPDITLMVLLRRLATVPNLDIHILSGRSHDVLDQWFQGLNIHLHAEHGAMSKGLTDRQWTSAVTNRADWQPVVRSLLEDFTKKTPGSFIEEKKYSFSWHFRMADPVLGERMADELQKHAAETFALLGLEAVAGKKVVEIRHIGINSGMVVSRVLAKDDTKAFPVAIGDDVPDADMFAPVAAAGMTIAVGEQPAEAHYRLRFPSEVRQLLELLTFPSRDRKLH